jgi:hypothetical protein
MIYRPFYAPASDPSGTSLHSTTNRTNVKTEISQWQWNFLTATNLQCPQANRPSFRQNAAGSQFAHVNEVSGNSFMPARAIKGLWSKPRAKLSWYGIRISEAFIRIVKNPLESYRTSARYWFSRIDSVSSLREPFLAGGSYKSPRIIGFKYHFRLKSSS